MYYQGRHRTWSGQLRHKQQGRQKYQADATVRWWSRLGADCLGSNVAGCLPNHRLLDAGVADGYSCHDADLYPIQGGELEAGSPIQLLWRFMPAKVMG